MKRQSGKGFMTRGVWAVLGSSLAFALLPVFLRLAYQEGADPSSLMMARTGFAAFLAGVFCLTTHRSLVMKRREGTVMLGAMLAYSAMSLCFNSACEEMESGVVNALFHLSPLFVVFASIAAKKAATRKRGIIAVIIACLGCLLLAAAPNSAIPLSGAALATLAAFFSALYTLVLGSTRLRGVDPIAVTFYVCLGAFLAAGCSGMVSERPLSLPLPSAGWALLSALISTVGAMALFVYGTQRIGALSASIISNAEVLFTPLAGSVVLSEALDSMSLFGYVAIAASCILAGSTTRHTANEAPASAMPDTSHSTSGKDDDASL